MAHLLQVVRGNRVAHQAVRVAVVLGAGFAHRFHHLEGRIGAFGNVERKHQARPAVRHHLRKRALRYHRGGQRPAGNGDIRGDARYMLRVLQRVEQALLVGPLAFRHHHHPGLRLPERVVHARGFLPQLAFGRVEVGRSVMEVGAALGQIRRHGHQHHHNRHGHHQLLAHLRELVERRNKVSVLGAVKHAQAQQNQARHKEHHREEREHDALRQNDAHVHADAEAHHREREEPEERYRRAGEHHRKAALHGVRHGCFGVGELALAAAERVQQHDGVVHGNRQLKDGAADLADEADLAHYQVRAHVQHDGHADDRKEYHRLEPGMRGQKQDQRDDEHADNQDERNFLGSRLLRGRRGYRLAFERDLGGARFLARLTDKRHGFLALARFYGHPEQVALVGFPIGDDVRILQGRGNVGVHRGAQPHNLAHTVDFGKLLRKSVGGGKVDTFHIGTSVRDGAAERVFHVVERHHRCRIFGQVVGHGVVHLHLRDAGRAGQRHQDEPDGYRLAMPQERLAELQHAPAPFPAEPEAEACGVRFFGRFGSTCFSSLVV